MVVDKRKGIALGLLQMEYDERIANERSLPLFGEEGLSRLKEKKVAIVGLGGVGGHAAEALCRAGVGTLYLIDGDEFTLSNLNRQRFATMSSLGKNKAEIVASALKDIRPTGEFIAIPRFVDPENMDEFPFLDCDYVVDAIDQVTSKIALIIYCIERDIPILSSMGTGNKMDPTKLRIADLSETEMDPLAKKMRRELRKRGITELDVVFSSEKSPSKKTEDGKPIVASSPFVPSVAGILMAKEVCKNMLLAN